MPNGTHHAPYHCDPSGDPPLSLQPPNFSTNRLRARLGIDIINGLHQQTVGGNKVPHTNRNHAVA
jgi:hypothetical protein